MNTKLRKRINTIGKVGKIITIILIVLMFIASAALATAAVVVSVLPNDTISVNVSGDVHVAFGKTVFGLISSEIVDGVNQTADKTYNAAGGGTVQVSAENIDGAAVVNVHGDGISANSGIAAPAVLLALVNVAGIIVCLFFFKALMNELAHADSPFTDGVVQKMRNFAISLLPAAVVSSVSETVITYLFSVGRSLSMSLNLMPVIFALIIFVLAEIFRYGVLLQKESDETL